MQFFEFFSPSKIHAFEMERIAIYFGYMCGHFIKKSRKTQNSLAIALEICVLFSE